MLTCFQQSLRGYKIYLKLFSWIFILLLIFSNSIFAQSNGKIGGVVVDADLGEGLIGVNVFLENTSFGAATDIDGNYLIPNLPAGEYNIVFSMIGYTKKTVTGVRVEAGQVTKVDVILSLETYETDEIVITAKAAENSAAGLLVKRQKSTAVTDAVSAEQFSRSGSGDAAEAVKMVVGASVVDGKYVYVRGLGDRYSSTQLNGAELPSSDPNRKAFQMDLLPTNLLDNIVTIKTFTPDKPGNFSGGIVDIGTRNFPEAFTLNLSTSATYHAEATNNSNFLTYSGGNTDWLGTDDGTRGIPSVLNNPDVVVPNAVQARFDTEKALELDAMSKAFNNIMDVKRQAPPINQSLAFSIGDQIKIGEVSSIGYLGSLTYGRNYSYYENGEVGIYRLNQGSPTLNNQIKLKDAAGKSESNLGALGTVSFNINPQHQLSTNVFYSRTGISTARFQEGVWPQELDNTRIVRNRILGWSERDITSTQISGKHSLDFLYNIAADWSVSLAKTTQEDPDLRLIFSIEDSTRNPSTHTIRGSNFDDPSRYFRNLEDNLNTYMVNFSIPFSQWNGLSSKFKFGGQLQNVDRTFTERIFSYLPINQYFNDAEGNPTELFSDQNNGIVEIDTLSNGTQRYNFGNVIRDNSRARNNYSGNQDVAAVYGMIDIPIFNRLRFIGGVRYETTEIEVISQDTTLNKGSIKEEDLLPSINFVYNLSPDMNLRLAATQTLARPTFRELAPFSSKEFVNGVELQGNPDLQRTLIQNYDLRWEWFTRPGEIIAVSGFYKILKNPIERTFAVGTTESNRIETYTNVDEATILGAEFEARVRLDYFWSDLSNFSIGTNLSIVDSDIDIAENELNSRRAIDSTASSTRDLQGQSPYIINLDFSYYNFNTGTTASLYFNTFGERLAKVSTNLTPDVYELSISQLDFILSQEVFQNFTFKLTVKNILNSSFKEVYKYRGEEYIWQEYKRGLTYSLGVSYKI